MEAKLAYKVRSVLLKSLNITGRNSSIRREYSVTGLDENRLIFNCPLSLL